MTATIIGVDPGERWVGIAVRRGRELLDHAVLDRHAVMHRDATTPAAGPIVAPEQLSNWMDRVTAHLDVALSYLPHGADLVAIEFTGAPRGHAHDRDGGHLIGLGPLMATAQIGGAVYGWARGHALRAAYVTPTRHGSIDLPAGTPAKVARAALVQSYPPALVGERETTGAGKSPRQHARSAWDISLAVRMTEAAVG